MGTLIDKHFSTTKEGQQALKDITFADRRRPVTMRKSASGTETITLKPNGKFIVHTDEAITKKQIVLREDQENSPEEVKILQRQLQLHGYEEVPINGKFEDSTKQAVMKFQDSQKLDADGVVGPLTWKKLGVVKVPQDIAEQYFKTWYAPGTNTRVNSAIAIEVKQEASSSNTDASDKPPDNAPSIEAVEGKSTITNNGVVIKFNITEITDHTAYNKALEENKIILTKEAGSNDLKVTIYDKTYPLEGVFDPKSVNETNVSKAQLSKTAPGWIQFGDGKTQIRFSQFLAKKPMGESV